MYEQTVGTFGVGSAAYHWEWAAGALSRLAQHVVSCRAFFWLHVMADDLDVEAEGPDFRGGTLHCLRSGGGRGDSNRMEEGARRHHGRMDRL